MADGALMIEIKRVEVSSAWVNIRDWENQGLSFGS